MKKLINFLIVLFNPYLYSFFEGLAIQTGTIRFIIEPGSGITPQGKIQDVADRLNLKGLNLQQGTTFVKYDTLPLDGRTLYEFFKGSQNRVFPFSNTGSFGNKLEQGESMVVLNYSLSICEYNSTPNAGFASFTSIDLVAYPNIMGAELEVKISNSTVLKPIPVLSSVATFNKDAKFSDLTGTIGNQAVFSFNTFIRSTPSGAKNVAVTENESLELFSFSL